MSGSGISPALEKYKERQAQKLSPEEKAIDSAEHRFGYVDRYIKASFKIRNNGIAPIGDRNDGEAVLKVLENKYDIEYYEADESGKEMSDELKRLPGYIALGRLSEHFVLDSRTNERLLSCAQEAVKHGDIKGEMAEAMVSAVQAHHKVQYDVDGAQESAVLAVNNLRDIVNSCMDMGTADRDYYILQGAIEEMRTMSRKGSFVAVLPETSKLVLKNAVESFDASSEHESLFRPGERAHWGVELTQ